MFAPKTSLSSVVAIKPGEANYLRIKVVPRQPRTEYIDMREDETIRIRLRAVPEKWQANKELVRYLAEELRVARDNIEIVAGVADTIKLVRIRS